MSGARSVVRWISHARPDRTEGPRHRGKVTCRQIAAGSSGASVRIDSTIFSGSESVRLLEPARFAVRPSSPSWNPPEGCPSRVEKFALIRQELQFRPKNACYSWLCPMNNDRTGCGVRVAFRRLRLWAINQDVVVASPKWALHLSKRGIGRNNGLPEAAYQKYVS